MRRNQRRRVAAPTAEQHRQRGNNSSAKAQARRIPLEL